MSVIKEAEGSIKTKMANQSKGKEENLADTGIVSYIGKSLEGGFFKNLLNNSVPYSKLNDNNSFNYYNINFYDKISKSSFFGSINFRSISEKDLSNEKINEIKKNQKKFLLLYFKFFGEKKEKKKI
jgi:hypothetical protein